MDDQHFIDVYDNVRYSKYMITLHNLIKYTETSRTKQEKISINSNTLVIIQNTLVTVLKNIAINIKMIWITFAEKYIPSILDILTRS